MVVGGDLPASFRCDVFEVQDRTVVIVRGELDFATAPDLLRHAVTALEHRPIAAIEVDLGLVTFADSSGLGALLAIKHDADDRGVTFTLGSVTPAVRLVIDVTGLNEHFDISPDSSR